MEDKDILLFPVRCFTCGKVLGHYQSNFENSNDWGKTLDEIGIKRLCCRLTILQTVPIVTGYGNVQPSKFQKPIYLTEKKFNELFEEVEEEEEMVVEEKKTIPAIPNIPGVVGIDNSLLLNFENLTLKEKLKQSIVTNEEDTVLLVKQEGERTNYGYIEPIDKKVYPAI